MDEGAPHLAAAGSGEGRAVVGSGVGSSGGGPGLLPHSHQPGMRPLSSYASEPPSTLSAMKTYAQELLAGQGEEQRLHGGATIPARGIELPPLPPGARQLAGFERPPHFQLGPNVSTPRRRTASAEAGRDVSGSGSTTPRKPTLRSSIGWVTSRSPSNGEASVLEHRVAGDLIMPAATMQQLAAAAAAGGPAVGSPTKEALRRRSVMRASQPSACQPSPSVKGAGPVNTPHASPVKKSFGRRG